MSRDFSAPVSELKPKPPRSRMGLLIAIGLLAAAIAAAAYVLKPILFPPWSPLDAPSGQALGRTVPQFLVEDLGALRKGRTPDEVKAKIPGLFTPEERAALGPEVLSSLEAVLGTAVDLESADFTKELHDRFERDAVFLNQALVAKGLPFHVDPSVIVGPTKTYSVLYTFYVEREHQLLAGEKKVRAIHVQRLDNLSFARAATGYTKPSSSAALILLDQIEYELLHVVLPAAAAGDENLLIDAESVSAKDEWQGKAQAQASKIARAALGEMPEADPAKVDEMARLLRRRRVLLRQWRTALDKQHIHLREPRRLTPEMDYAHELFNKIPNPELIEWRSIHERLQDPKLRAAFYSMVYILGRTVEQHEAQHQVDLDAEKILMPAPLAKMWGFDAPDDAIDSSYHRYAAGEVSAYLAEIARAPGSPKLVILTLLENLFDREAWGSAYSEAALGVVYAMSKELGLPTDVLVGRGEVRRRELTDRFIAITDRPDADLRQAAKRAWQWLYEGPLVDVTVAQTRTEKPWIR